MIDVVERVVKLEHEMGDNAELMADALPKLEADFCVFALYMSHNRCRLV